jgi:hypothetical protein
VLIMKKTLWKNNLNFLKVVPMTYVNFITIVIIISEKNRRHYIRTGLHTLHKTILEFITKLRECISLLKLILNL